MFDISLHHLAPSANKSCFVLAEWERAKNILKKYAFHSESTFSTLLSWTLSSIDLLRAAINWIGFLVEFITVNRRSVREGQATLQTKNVKEKKKEVTVVASFEKW